MFWIIDKLRGKLAKNSEKMLEETNHFLNKGLKTIKDVNVTTRNLRCTREEQIKKIKSDIEQHEKDWEECRKKNSKKAEKYSSLIKIKKGFLDKEARALKQTECDIDMEETSLRYFENAIALAESYKDRLVYETSISEMYSQAMERLRSVLNKRYLKSSAKNFEIVENTILKLNTAIEHVRTGIRSDFSLENPGKRPQITQTNSMLPESKITFSYGNGTEPSHVDEVLELEERVRYKEKEIDRIAAEYTQKQEQLENEREEIGKAGNDMNAQRESLNTFKEELDARESELKEEEKRLHNPEVLLEKAQEYINLSQNKDKLQVKLDELRREIKKVGTGNSEILRDIQEKEEERDKIEAENKELLVKEERLEQELASLKDSQSEMSEIVKMMKKQIKKLEKDNQKLMQEKNATEQRNSELEDKAIQIQSEYEDKIKEQQALLKELDELKDRLSSINTKDMKVDLKNRIEGLLAELAADSDIQI